MNSDELTATACLAVRRLTPIKKAQFLLDAALGLIEDGFYVGKEVEIYLDVCLKTPGLPKEDVKKALLVRRLAGERLQCHPSDGQVRPSELPIREIRSSVDPACQRIPPEIWDQIAAQTPRYHLRKWLFISPLHRRIASRHLFHTIHIDFLEFQDLDRGLDILERAINDPLFASWVKSLHLRFDTPDDFGYTSDVILRFLNTSLRAFKALRDFEWIGYIEMPEEMVRVLSHKCLHGLGFKEWHFDAASVSAFHNLRKFAFKMDKDGGESDLEDTRAVLDLSQNTLKDLTLNGGSYVDGSLDSVFESATINNLTHLDLSTMAISNFVLDHISKAENLQSLTLRGSFEEPDFASLMFATDISLPRLESFSFVMDDDDERLQDSAMYFLRKREKLRRLNLGTYPQEIDAIQGILPGLNNLRVLAVCIAELSQEQFKSLVNTIPMQMVAIKISVCSSEIPLDEYAQYFTRFNTLSFLDLQIWGNPAQAAPISNNDRQIQTDRLLRNIAATVPSLDFLKWHGKLYLILRSHGDMGSTLDFKEVQTNSRVEYGSGIDIVSEDIAWLQHKTSSQWHSEETEE